MGFAYSDEFIEGNGEELEEELSAAEQEELRILPGLKSDDDSGDDTESDAFTEEEYEAFVANLYDAAFNREADGPGLSY